MARLRHPNIVHIYNLGQPDEVPHFVMEYVRRLADGGGTRLTLEQKVELMHKIVLSVDFLHQHQVVHRDLKPGNILVGPDLDPKSLTSAWPSDRRRPAFDPGGRDHGNTGLLFARTVPRGHRSTLAAIFSPSDHPLSAAYGNTAFRSEKLSDQMHSICEQDPVLPGESIQVSRDLQNVCLKALEKNPATATRPRVKWRMTWRDTSPASRCRPVQSHTRG